MGHLYHSYVSLPHTSPQQLRLQQHPLAWPHETDSESSSCGLAPWENTTYFIQLHIFTCIYIKKKQQQQIQCNYNFPQKRANELQRAELSKQEQT